MDFTDKNQSRNMNTRKTRSQDSSQVASCVGQGQNQQPGNQNSPKNDPAIPPSRPITGSCEKDVEEKCKQCYVTYELRRDQTPNMMDDVKQKNQKSTIFAPSYVSELVNRLLGLMPANTGLQVGDTLVSKFATFDALKKLQLLSRNESSNVSGVIKSSLYANIGIQRSTLLSLKDLVRQTVIVSKAFTTHYGGYRTHKETQRRPVYIADLSALQFQQRENTGRLVLLAEHDLQKGALDDAIFERVVGEARPDLEMISALFKGDERYVPTRSRVFGTVYFDTVAYKRFVAKDVVLTGLAFNFFAHADENQPINYKFLKYGSGFFAGEFGPLIEKHILSGVLDGLTTLFEHHEVPCIQQVELPFFVNTEKIRVKEIEIRFRRRIVFSQEDALKETHKDFVTATTNCADPHAVFGNEMGYQSVDAAIAQNLEGFGRQFCPLLNKSMGSEYVNV